MKKYIKDMSRDASIIMLDVWYYGETTGFKDWYGLAHPIIPEIIIDNNDGLADVYYDPEGIEWVKDYALKLLKEDPKFIKKSIDRYLKLVKELKKIWEKKKPLSKEELKPFYDKMRLAWTGLEISYRFPYVNSEEFKKDIVYAQKAREETDKFFDSADYVVCLTLKKLFPELSLLSKYLTIEEAVSGEVPSKEQLEKRKHHYVWAENRLFENVSLEEIEKKYDVVVDKGVVPKGLKELKGTSAYQGIVEGKVRLIKTKDLIDSVKEGDILVAPMTTPSYIPAMKKAAAFVTDEGGITCHAAIVARELKKPCIVGTRIATKWLRDGDEVEVDADKGTVKKITH